MQILLPRAPGQVRYIVVQVMNSSIQVLPVSAQAEKALIFPTAH